MRSVAFHGCAGWLYDGSSRRGVVICPPLGLEELCGRRTLHLLAGRLQAGGVATLRFDYRGEGDSVGDANDPDCVARWRDDVTAAIECLRSLAGVEEVALVGMRFGALLAADIAAGREDISRLALIAPVATGKIWLRETRILSRMIQTEGPRDAASDRDDLGLAGFTLTDETCAAIGGMDATALARAPAPSILLIEPATGRAAARLTTHFQSLGAEVETREFIDYEMMMCDPALSTPAVAMVEPIAAWVSQGASAAGARIAAAAGPEAQIVGDHWRERSVSFGRHPLRGVYCEPAAGPVRRTALLSGPGNNHHIGWGRSHVELARTLAGAGVASLRFDYAGIGESGGDIHDIYDDRRIEHIEAAIAWLRAGGATDVALVGVCSGAYHSLRAAARDPAILRLALLNQQRYAIDLHHKLSWLSYRLQARVAFALDAKEGASGFRARLLALALAMIPKVRRMGSLARSLVRRLKNPSRDDEPTRGNAVEQTFSALSKRGAQVLIVHSPDDPAVVELERFMGPGGERATALPGLRKVVLEDADHLLSSRAARKLYAAELIRFLT